jgi:hypothetical protein
VSFFKRFIDKPISKDQFAELAIEAMVRCGWQRPEYDASMFVLRVGTNEVQALNNVYDAFQAAPKDERQTLLDTWFAGMWDRKIPETFEAAKPSLMLMLRQRKEPLLTQYRLGLAKCPEMFGKRFTEQLDLAVFIDRPTAMTRLTPEAVKEWGIAADDAFGVALENLRRNGAPKWMELRSGVFRSTWGDSYDAGRIMLIDMMDGPPVKGEKIVMTPDRDTILVAGSDDPDALQQMAQLALSIYDRDSYQLSAQPLVLRDGTWHAYEIAEPARFEIAKRIVGQTQNAYDMQQQLLEKSRTDDIFVAKFTAFASEPARQVLSICPWPKDAVSSLPKTEVIMLSLGETDAFRVTWSDAMRIAGDLMEPLDCWPPRYRVATFPEGEKLAALRAAAQS